MEECFRKWDIMLSENEIQKFYTKYFSPNWVSEAWTQQYSGSINADTASEVVKKVIQEAVTSGKTGHLPESDYDQFQGSQPSENDVDV